MNTYQFKYHDEFQLEGLSPDQLRRLEYIDRLLDDRFIEYDPAYLQSLSDAELRDLVGMLPKPCVATPVSAKPARFVNPYPVVKYKATIWHQGRTVSLGWFMSEQVRDEAVTMAKTMRNLGVPLEAIRESVQRMTK